MNSRRSIHRSRILGYAYYRDQTERPVFYQYLISKYLNTGLGDEQPPINPTIILNHLRKFVKDGDLKSIPDNGQATIDEHPYLPPLSPNHNIHLTRKYYQITEDGKHTFMSDLLSQISTADESRHMRRNIRELLYPEKLGLFIASHPLVQQAIWENITGFQVDEIAPFSALSPQDKHPESISNPPRVEQSPGIDPATSGQKTTEQLLAESHLTL